MVALTLFQYNLYALVMIVAIVITCLAVIGFGFLLTSDSDVSWQERLIGLAVGVVCGNAMLWMIMNYTAIDEWIKGFKG